MTLSDALSTIAKLAPLLRVEAIAADRETQFPELSVKALREAGLFAAGIPTEYGGLGFTPAELAEVAAAIGECCGSTAMIFAMHQLQVGCLTMGTASLEITEFLRRAAREQLLVASVTSEEGIGGDMRRSDAALRPDLTFTKRASTISYGAQADALLVTLRRDENAEQHDQVLVLAHSSQVTLTPTGSWNTMGMRGTCSPGFQVDAAVRAQQVLPLPFAQIASGCMVPLSHLLWSAVWTGIAADAVRRAALLVRRKAHAMGHSDPRLAAAHAQLSLLRAAVAQFAAQYHGPDVEISESVTVAANALKLTVSMQAVQVVERALEICGVPGYQETGDYSVARHLRDLYSARLMIANTKLEQANAELLLLTGTGASS